MIQSLQGWRPQPLVRACMYGHHSNAHSCSVDSHLLTGLHGAPEHLHALDLLLHLVLWQLKHLPHLC